MALTDINTIKNIILFSPVILNPIRNAAVLLQNTSRSQFPHRSLVEDSEIVKLNAVPAPLLDPLSPITLLAGAPITLTHTAIMPDTVVVAADLGLITVYVENLDYVIDYDDGTITVANPANNITPGDAVYVWTQYFSIMSAATDYVIDYQQGTIARRLGSDIPTNAFVSVDYQHSLNQPTDAAILEAITQADQWFKPRLRSPYTLESTDNGLKAAASLYVVHLLCLSMSFAELGAAARSQSDDLARRWLELAESYKSTAMSHLSKYLQFSALDHAHLVQNRFAASRTIQRQSPQLDTSERTY